MKNVTKILMACVLGLMIAGEAGATGKRVAKSRAKIGKAHVKRAPKQKAPAPVGEIGQSHKVRTKKDKAA